jgi:hypothetical protein
MVLRKKGEVNDPYAYSIKIKPEFDARSLFKLRDAMEDRFEKILEISREKLKQKKKQTKSPVTDEWMAKEYPKGMFDKIKGWLLSKLFSLAFRWSKGGIARALAKGAIMWMLKDLEKMNLLEGYSKREKK